MSDKEFAEKIDALRKEYSFDVEALHLKADKILLEILALHGYHNTVSAFNELPKWYA